MTQKEFADSIISHSERKRLEVSQHGCVSYEQFLKIANDLKTIFLKSIGEIPDGIIITCELASATMSPSKTQARNHIKNAKALTSGVASFALIITAIGMALGWGSGAVATVVTFFVGVNTVPIIGQLAAGVFLAAIAGYFYLHEESQQEKTEKAFKVLADGLYKYILSDEFGNKYNNKLLNLNKS